MPRPKEFVVRLSASDRAKLVKVVSSGRHPARMITRARVLLALDESREPAPDRRVVAERLGTSESTVYLVAKAFAAGGRVAGDASGRAEGDRGGRGSADRVGVYPAAPPPRAGTVDAATARDRWP